MGCRWKYDDHSDFWETECGEGFVFIDGDPLSNKMRFCPYCGNPLLQTQKEASL